MGRMGIYGGWREMEGVNIIGLEFGIVWVGLGCRRNLDEGK